MKRHKYHINIFYSDEDRCYVADVPDLEFCSAFGDTPEEAAREIQVAMDGWIETARDTGVPVPRPRYSPAIYLANSPVKRALKPKKTVRTVSKKSKEAQVTAA